jgi:AcrR family transcriptional regulator
MAKVNLERRAEIGIAKRARTRAAILEAARACYAAPTAAPITVEAVMQAAGLAKGTFYVHFQDLAALEVELAAALINELDGRLQPARLTADHPLTRLATAVGILLHDLASAPPRARLVARALASVPEVGDAMRAHLRQDLRAARAEGLLAMNSVDLAALVVAGLCEQAVREIGNGRIEKKAVPDIVRAVLRAIGCAPPDAAMHAEEAARHAKAFPQQKASLDGARS